MLAPTFNFYFLQLIQDCCLAHSLIDNSVSQFKWSLLSKHWAMSQFKPSGPFSFLRAAPFYLSFFSSGRQKLILLAHGSRERGCWTKQSSGSSLISAEMCLTHLVINPTWAFETLC